MAVRPPPKALPLRYAAAAPGPAAETHDVRMTTHDHDRRFWVVDCDADSVAVARRVSGVPGAPRRRVGLEGGAARCSAGWPTAADARPKPAAQQPLRPPAFPAPSRHLPHGPAQRVLAQAQRTRLASLTAVPHDHRARSAS
jgi:hypothetical protein